MANTQSRPVWVDINLDHIAYNLGRVRALCPTAKVMAVIKADGYGHGMLNVAKALSAADGFGVNSIDDVTRLHNAGIFKPCHLLAPNITRDTLMFCAEHQCCPTIYDHTHLALLEALPPTCRLDIWLKVDTGMGRLGFMPNEVARVLERLKGMQTVANIHLMSHLGSADEIHKELNLQQFSQFNSLVSKGQFVSHSILNSAGIVGFAEHAHDWIRPGVMLYGLSPSKHLTRSELGLKPAMNFNSRIISIKKINKGHGVGYASTFIAPQTMRIAVVSVGYGDGYPRHAPTGTPVWLNGALVQLIGRVSMDMLVLDLRGLDAEGVSTNVGDVVQLWGDHNAVEDVADYAGTIGYELTCGILPRVERKIIPAQSQHAHDRAVNKTAVGLSDNG